MATLEDARSALESAASSYGPYELGVFHLQPAADADGADFLLVGINSDHAEASDVLTDWETTYSDLTLETTTPLTGHETVEVREYRLSDDS